MIKGKISTKFRHVQTFLRGTEKNKLHIAFLFKVSPQLAFVRHALHLLNDWILTNVISFEGCSDGKKLDLHLFTVVFSNCTFLSSVFNVCSPHAFIFPNCLLGDGTMVTPQYATSSPTNATVTLSPLMKKMVFTITGNVEIETSSARRSDNGGGIGTGNGTSRK